MNESQLLAVAEHIDIGQYRVPFVGRANIWVQDSVTDPASLKLTQWLVSEAVAKTQPGQLEVIVFDDALTGIAAPFASLNTGGEKLLRTIGGAEELAATLAHLKRHVQAVNAVMQGLAPGLIDFRQLVGYPVESYKLVVLSEDLSQLDEHTQNQLSVLLNAGPRAGVSFLIHSPLMDVEYLAQRCEQWRVQQDGLYYNEHPLTSKWQPLDAQHMIDGAEEVAKRVATAQMDSISFTQVQPMTQPWRGSSANGITFMLGRYGLESVSVTLGDELNQRHNMLVTGAVGQGKSNLLSVMIHSLCQSYSPDELGLYLLDFKEGVTLRPFYDETSGEYLPQARVLGLEADREFGLSVFRHLYAEYKSRMRAFKEASVQNLREYRELLPEAIMPRLVVVVDEFQMMFSERDQIADEIADLLIKGARLFRASGIHIVLASQTIGGNLALMGSGGEGLFAQIPVRVALKNSLSESHATLGTKNDAAAYLRTRQAIVNLDYGEPSANRKTTVAFADESVLSGLRHGWWLAHREKGTEPYVFEGDRQRSFRDDAAWLHAHEAAGLSALLGYRIEVDARPMSVPFGRDIGRNIAVVGSGKATTEIANICLSLATQSGARAEFVLLDRAENDGFWADHRDEVLAALEHAGSRVSVVSPEDTDSVLMRLTQDVGGGPLPTDREVFVVGLGLDRYRALPMEFQTLCREGAGAGVHIIGWWAKYESFREHVGFGGDSYFDTKIAFKLDPSSAKQLMNDPLLQWVAPDNRALVWDSMTLTEPSRMIPYSRFAPSEMNPAA